MNTEQFLFGRPSLDVQENVEPFNSFTDYADETFASFDAFYQSVLSLLSSNGWDSKSGKAVDIEEADQKFDMPDNDTLKKWYEKYKPS